MKCHEVSRLLVGFGDGELPEQQAETVAAHLSECAGCRSLYEGLRADLRLMQGEPEPVPPPGLATRAMAQVRALERPAVRKPALGVPRLASLAAGVFLAGAGFCSGVALGRAIARRMPTVAEQLLGPGAGESGMESEAR